MEISENQIKNFNELQLYNGYIDIKVKFTEDYTVIDNLNWTILSIIYFFKLLFSGEKIICLIYIKKAVLNPVSFVWGG